jgi:hypothetical protein
MVINMLVSFNYSKSRLVFRILRTGKDLLAVIEKYFKS